MVIRTERSIRFVNYAVNGAGVGHLTRLVAINRWVRRYCTFLGIRPEIYFLTSSEADSLLFAERFAGFKLPSKTVVADAGLDKTAYLALAKQWVWHSIGLLRPDLFVVDTFPRGAFGELLSALDLCRHKAFIYRPVKPEFGARPDFQAMLPLFDAIVVPEHADHAAVRVPEAARERVAYVGPVMARERQELLDRDAARKMLGIPDDALAVYVSAGGGGDAGAESTLLRLCELAGDPSLRLLVGAGPLYRGRRVWGPGILWLDGIAAAEVMPAMDLAVCAAGYNTYHEVLFAGVPAIFLPQAKIADEQDLRAERAVAAGAAVRLGPGAGLEEVRAAIDTLRDAAVRQHAAARARALVPRNCAREAAAELLRLVVPEREVELAEEAVDDEFLDALRGAPFDHETVCSLAARLEGRRKWGGPVAADAAAEESSLLVACRLLDTALAAGLPTPLAVRRLAAALATLPPGLPAERAARAWEALGVGREASTS